LTLPAAGSASFRAAKTAQDAAVYSVPLVSLPFFDSFTYSQTYADSTKWLPRQPALVCRNSAVRPPDYGTVLFDGLNAARTVYSINNEQGAADSLVTGYIDLSQAKPHFNLFLTFHFQYAGQNDPPYYEADTIVYAADADAPRPYYVSRTVWDSVSVTDTVVRPDTVLLSRFGPVEGSGERNDTLVNPRALPRNDTLKIRTFSLWDGPMDWPVFPSPSTLDTVVVGSLVAVRSYSHSDTSVVVRCDTVVRVFVALDTLFENLDSLIVGVRTVYDTLRQCDTLAVLNRYYTGTFRAFVSRTATDTLQVPAGETRYRIRHTADDSLTVFFRSADTTLRDPFVFVWSVNRENVLFRRDTFYRAVVPIDRPEFMHARFQVMFRNFGTRSGPFDCWHLDYVSIDAGVLPTAPTPDVSVSSVSRSPFPAPYTAVPHRHFADGHYPLGPWKVTVRNASTTDYSTDGALLTLFDPPNNTLWMQTPIVLTATAETFTEIEIPSPPEFYPPDYAGRPTYTFDVGATDARPANDRIVQPYLTREYLALDDGEPEYGYGVESRNAFAQKYRFHRDDRLTAVWLCFVHTPKIDSAAGKSFTLAVWKPDTFHPDSILYQKSNGVFTQYAPTLVDGNENAVFAQRYFYRYALDSAVAVQAGRDYYIGCIQRDDDLLAVGFDLSHDNKENIVFSNRRAWQYGRFSGTLMIRPEFESHRWSVGRDERTWSRRWAVYPNPVSEGEKVYVSGTNASAEYEWVDVTGRVAARGKTWDGTIPVPGAGLYVLRLENGAAVRVSVVRR
jgi:hypothetical protein